MRDTRQFGFDTVVELFIEETLCRRDPWRSTMYLEKLQRIMRKHTGAPTLNVTRVAFILRHVDTKGEQFLSSLIRLGCTLSGFCLFGEYEDHQLLVSELAKFLSSKVLVENVCLSNISSRHLSEFMDMAFVLQQRGLDLKVPTFDLLACCSFKTIEGYVVGIIQSLLAWVTEEEKHGRSSHISIWICQANNCAPLFNLASIPTLQRKAMVVLASVQAVAGKYQRTLNELEHFMRAQNEFLRTHVPLQQGEYWKFVCDLSRKYAK